ncbi:MAG TPA: outer membrane beta-barrel protein [Coxiellaceae bacterium]|nr:MAG: hypothetical protein A3E81_05310 [Gammaproteobacteria bacterium RIFCSPHIGHO2_12_FULL_36_30]HLB57037.1 outer membrane beta-barrel protein [Coxiellaceae bacterium]
MRRIIQIPTFFLLSIVAINTFAGGFDYNKEDTSGYSDYSVQPNFQVNDGTNYTRNGHAVYFFGGYVYTYRLLNSTTSSIYNPITNVTYSFDPNSLFSNSASNIEVGAGREMSKYINFEAAYIQQFTANKNGDIGGIATTTSVKMSGLLLDMGIAFNPDDQFQVLGKLGAQLSQFTTSATVANSAAFTFNDSTKLDPAVGLEFLMQCSQNFAFRIDTMYVADAQSNQYSDGQIDTLAGINVSL